MQHKNQVGAGAAQAKRLLLIDGYGFLFRAYHSLPPLTNPQGVPVGAVYGFVTMLTKLLVAKGTDYVAVVLDAGKKTFRHDLYDQYKANRPPAPDDLIPQFPLIRQAAEALNLPVLEKMGYEADDIIATYAERAVAEGIDVTIVSADKDLAQLLNPHVKLYDPMKSRYITAEVIQEKYGVLPDKMLDLLALTGDSSDNIPGVPGIGPKTAALLLNEFGGFDQVFARVQEIKQDKRRQSLIEHQHNAILSRDLVRLCYTVPMEEPVSSLKARTIDRKVFAKFLMEQGFKTLLTRLEKEGEVPYVENETVAAVLPVQNTQAPKISMIDDEKTLAQWIQTAQQRAILVTCIHYDLKTSEPLYLVLATDAREVAVVPLVSCLGTPQGNLFDQAPKVHGIPVKQVWTILVPLLAQASLLKIGHDVKKVLRTLWQDYPAIAVTPYDDLMLMSYVISTGVHDHTLADLAFNYMGIEKEKLQPLIDKKATADMVKTTLAEVGLIMVDLHRYLKQRLFNDHMLALYEKLEKPLIEVLAKMETAGIKVDLAMLQSLSAEFAKDIANLEREIFKLAGKEFNIGSPKQLGEILFVDMGLTGGKKSKKSDSYSTDVEVLEQLEAEGFEIARNILQWRTFSKLKSTYTDALAKQIQSDGRVHTHYAMAAVNTGRLSSYDPNLQNIPVRTEAGNKIRAVFIAEKGFKLLSADYSQIELRLLSDLAGIETLQQAFHEGKDIHAITASQIFGVPLEEVTPELRRSAKTINFGIIYGMSGFGLARRLGIERGEAGEYINKYFAQYPGIRAYMERTKAQVREQGYVTTLWGRKCHIKGINDKNGAVRQFAERAAINAPLQVLSSRSTTQKPGYYYKYMMNWSLKFLNPKLRKLFHW
jgi:DNA polymerase I